MADLRLEGQELVETKQYIVVQIGNEKYGIDISYIDNIVRMQKITRVPKVQSYIKGVINLRGEIVPIMDLRITMGLETIEDTKDTRIIIIKMESIGKLGLIVDCVKEVVTLVDDQIENLIHDSKDDSTHFVNAVGKVGDSIISLLDLNTVVLDKTVKEENA